MIVDSPLESVRGLLLLVDDRAYAACFGDAGGMLAKDRFGLPTRSILFELQMDLSRLLGECEAELGFTPVLRARVQVPQVPVSRFDDP